MTMAKVLTDSFFETIEIKLFDFHAGLQGLCSIWLANACDTRSERGAPHEPVPHLRPPCRRRLCAARHGVLPRRRGGRHARRCFAGWNLDARGRRRAAPGWLTLA